MEKLPLTGIRILDLSRVLAGPWATQLLADFGADVVKIEKPEVGDDTRHWGPPFLPNGDAAYFLCANRNKQSVAIDVASSEGQAEIKRLALKADVVVENFKVGGLEKYGLSMRQLREIHPSLITCSITGFGQTGPYADRAGYDFLVQGMGGLMSVTGEPHGAPMKVGVALTDILAGLYAANAIQAALRHRDQTGEGQEIDLSLFDVTVACLANQAMNYLNGGLIPERLGNDHPNIVPYSVFPTLDGHMIVAIGNDAQFARFAEILGESRWARDKRYKTNESRVAHRDQLNDMIGALTRRFYTRSWMTKLEPAGIPCGPINKLDAVFQDPQVLARNMVEEVDHVSGPVKLVRNPIHFSKMPTPPTKAPPVLASSSLEQIWNDE